MRVHNRKAVEKAIKVFFGIFTKFAPCHGLLLEKYQVADIAILFSLAQFQECNAIEFLSTL